MELVYPNQAPKLNTLDLILGLNTKVLMQQTSGLHHANPPLVKISPTL